MRPAITGYRSYHICPVSKEKSNITNVCGELVQFTVGAEAQYFI